MTSNNIKLIISNETVCIMQFFFFFQVTFLPLEFIETLLVTLAGVVFAIFFDTLAMTFATQNY